MKTDLKLTRFAELHLCVQIYLRRCSDGVGSGAEHGALREADDQPDWGGQVPAEQPAKIRAAGGPVKSTLSIFNYMYWLQCRRSHVPGYTNRGAHEQPSAAHALLTNQMHIAWRATVLHADVCHVFIFYLSIYGAYMYRARLRLQILPIVLFRTAHPLFPTILEVATRTSSLAVLLSLPVDIWWLAFIIIML